MSSLKAMEVALNEDKISIIEAGAAALAAGVMQIRQALAQGQISQERVKDAEAEIEKALNQQLFALAWKRELLQTRGAVTDSPSP